MRTIIVGAVVLACAGFTGVVFGQDDALIRNPGFEADADGDGIPDGWSFAWRSTHQGDAQRGIEKREPDWGWDRRVKHSGAASIRCGVSRAVDDGVWTQDGVEIPEGARYLKVTAWCRARDVKDGAGTVGIVFLGEQKKWLGARYEAIAVVQECDWTQYTGYVEVPKGARTIRLRCWTNFAYRGTGTFWFDDLELVQVDEMVRPKTIYLDDESAPEPTDEERRRGFLLFSRGYMRVLFPNSVPKAEERVEALSAAACPGEREPVAFAVRALRQLRDVRVMVSSLSGDGYTIPAGEIEVRSVRYHPKEGQSRWGPFNETLMDVPLFLEKRDGLRIAADTNQPFWVTVHVPQDASAGEYEGSVVIEEGGQRRASLPLTLRVWPFRLAEPRGVTFAMYTRMRTDPAWIAETFADMRAHGMTSVALCGNSGLSLSAEGGRVRVEWNGESALERNMDEYARAGFPEPMVWLMGGDIPAFCERIGPIQTEEFAEAYRGVIAAINAHGEQVGWPEIVYQPIDEPYEHSARLERSTRLLEILKTIPGVRTEEDGMNGRWENFTEDHYRLCDVFVLHDGPTLHRGQLDMDEWRDFHRRATADGKQIWFYNIDLTAWHPEPVRFMTGFGLWKSGASGIIEWAYMFPVKEDDPGAVYRQPRALLYRFPRAGGESGGPTIGYEAVREGVDDYRYLLTLSRLVEEARRSDDANVRRLAEEVWKPVQEKLDAAGFDGCKGSAA
ncbi:MAG: hypothetical protein ACE5O2_10700, partial [Armatimonadota bacterium]